DHVGKSVGVEKLRHHYRVRAVSQHADFHRGNVAIFRQDFQLFAQFRGGRVMDGLHVLGVLHHQRSDGRHTVTAVGSKSLEIRANAPAATRVKSPDRQQNGRGGDPLRVKMAHDSSSALAFREENSRSRLTWDTEASPHSRERPAPANVRALFSPCKEFFSDSGSYRGSALVR